MEKIVLLSFYLGLILVNFCADTSSLSLMIPRLPMYFLIFFFRKYWLSIG